jgi:hypothetical protein
VPEVRRTTNDFREFVRRHAQTLGAGLALSQRLRARADLERVTNRTRARNNHDSDADIIDAIIALASHGHFSAINERAASDQFDDRLASSQERRRRRLMGSGGNESHGGSDTITNGLRDTSERVGQPQRLAVNG